MSYRDWTEDSEHENGNYLCVCHVCKKGFIGHKRRIVCKACDAIDIEAFSRQQQRIGKMNGQRKGTIAYEVLHDNDIATCYDCREKIIASDDDAEVCIKCGGRNRRVEE